ARDRRPGAGRGPGRGDVERDPRRSDERDRRGGRGRLRRVGRRAVRDGHRVARHSGVVNAHTPPPATGYPGAALVTGAARGIGAAVARRLAADGFRVVCADAGAGATDPVLAYPLATREELDATIAAIGPVATAVQLDVRDADAVQAAIDATDELAVVVNAAGVVWGGAPLWEMPAVAWREVVDVNVTGVFHTVSAAVPAMLARPTPRTGRIVALASAGSSRGLPQMAAYSAAKHAVVGLVRSVAGELVDSGITINA